jgi:X-linked retinitis pigmentosa GTPase regulator
VGEEEEEKEEENEVVERSEGCEEGHRYFSSPIDFAVAVEAPLLKLDETEEVIESDFASVEAQQRGMGEMSPVSSSHADCEESSGEEENGDAITESVPVDLRGINGEDGGPGKLSRSSESQDDCLDPLPDSLQVTLTSSWPDDQTPIEREEEVMGVKEEKEKEEQEEEKEKEKGDEDDDDDDDDDEEGKGKEEEWNSEEGRRGGGGGGGAGMMPTSPPLKRLYYF